MIAENPCRIKGAGIERTAERPLLSRETVLDLADTIDACFRALVPLAGLGGLRLGELLGLRWEGVDLLHGSVRVEAQEQELAKGGRRRAAPKSAAGTKTVTLPPIVMDALREHLEAVGGRGADEPVFTGPKGGPLRRATRYSEWDGPGSARCRRCARARSGPRGRDLRGDDRGDATGDQGA